MKLALVPLFLLIFACVFGIAYNYGVSADAVNDNSLFGRLDDGSIGGLDNYTQYTDGEGTEIGYEDVSGTIGISLGGMVVVLFGLALVVGAIVGIQVMGTGLSDFSVKSIVVISIMEGIWLIFSSFGYNVLDTVPAFGKIVYFVLSMVYSFGVFSEIWV